MSFRIGQRVAVTAHWSSFVGRQGEVTAGEPPVFVRLDGELFPLRFGVGELKSLDDGPIELGFPGVGALTPKAR